MQDKLDQASGLSLEHFALMESKFDSHYHLIIQLPCKCDYDYANYVVLIQKST